MKLLLSIFIFLSPTLQAQNSWKLTPTKERLYKEIVSEFVIQDLGFFEDEDEEMRGWNKADSLFKDMPISIALKYCNDSSYSIKYYSFLKILGQNDSLAFIILSKYISDSTKINFQVEDIGGEVKFNEFLARAYETFIDSKYYWCDTKQIRHRKYFKKYPFKFTKMNYVKWPAILTSFVALVKPWNVKHYHNIEDLKYYWGIDYFKGR